MAAGKDKYLYITNRKDWREWLKINHDSQKETWLIFYKKHTGKKRIPYDDAVEEALCFGWIDSIVKRIDEEKYAQKFTPRRSNSQWSEVNKKRVMKMIKVKKMTKAGLIKIKQAKKNGKWSEVAANKKEFVLTPDIKKVLTANKKAWENFNKLAPSYKKNYIGWITSAKKKETRDKRLKEALKTLERGKKLGIK